MRRTPWGNADHLRERMLRPGPGTLAAEVARSQRERLFGAAIASVAAKGYEATTVADMLALSGVSRSAFYRHFPDKEACVLATFEALVEMAGRAAGEELGGAGRPRGQVRRVLDALFDGVLAFPAAARLCFSDIYTVGRRGRLAMSGALAGFAATLGEAVARERGEELPEAMVYGILGGVQRIVQLHLRREDPELLPGHAEDLCRWALAYEPPSAPLRRPGRRARPIEGPPPFVAYSQAERILRALAAAAGERGYPAVTIAEIAARAGVSQATFYSHFAGKQAALVAALDSAGSQMLGVAMPAARRAPDWRYAIRAAIGGLFDFYAAEPDYARLAAVETYAAGPVAVELRDRRIDEVRGLLEPALGSKPGTSPVVADAALGAVWSMLYKQVVDGGPRSLPEIAPLAAYMALAPFLGTAAATEIANSDGRVRAP